MKKERRREAAAKSGDRQVIIETPRNSRNKYKFDEQTGRMKLSKVLPEGMIFPYDFGFIPGTKAEDGDPLDVLVLSDEPMFPGCEVECRLIGVLKAEGKRERKPQRSHHCRGCRLGALRRHEAAIRSGLCRALPN